MSPHDEIRALWSTFVRLLRARDPLLPEGLGKRASARSAALAASLGLPDDWVALWSHHDGQTPALAGVFDGWFFLPLTAEDGEESVEVELVSATQAAADMEPLDRDQVRGPVQPVPWHPRWVPLCKDFGGSYLVVDLAPAPGGTVGQVVRVDEHWALEVVADGPAAWLRWAIDRIERGEDLPERWVRGDDGRLAPAGSLHIEIEDLATTAVGTPIPLGDSGVFAVVLHADAAGPLHPPNAHCWIPFTLDMPDPARSFRVDGMSVRTHDATRHVVGLQSGGGHPWHVLYSDAPIPAATTVHVELVVHPEGGPAPGPDDLLRMGRPLAVLGALGSEPIVDLERRRLRGRCRALLGDPRGAIIDLDGDAASTLHRAAALLDLGRASAALEALEGAGSWWTEAARLRIRALLALKRPEAALEVEVRDPASRLARADAFAQLRRFPEAAAEIEAILAGLPFGPDAAHAWLVDRAQRWRRQSAAPAPPSRAVVVADHEVPSVQAEVAPAPDGWTARVELSADQAARGTRVSVPLPDGEVVLDLPAGAGHDARLRFDGPAITVVVAIAAPAGGPYHVSFEKWDVLVDLPEAVAHGSVVLPVLGDSVEVELPGDARQGTEVRVPGRGLVRPRGQRGDLVLRVVAAGT